MQAYTAPCALFAQEDLENGEDVAECPSCSLIVKVIYDPVSLLHCYVHNTGRMFQHIIKIIIIGRFYPQSCQAVHYCMPESHSKLMYFTNDDNDENTL